jgi:hypothetical protein
MYAILGGTSLLLIAAYVALNAARQRGKK